nr:hypothetical protein [Acetobacter sacchari]
MAVSRTERVIGTSRSACVVGVGSGAAAASHTSINGAKTEAAPPHLLGVRMTEIRRNNDGEIEPCRDDPNSGSTCPAATPSQTLDLQLIHLCDTNDTIMN